MPDEPPAKPKPKTQRKRKPERTPENKAIEGAPEDKIVPIKRQTFFRFQKP
jgi:hypothetical protein